MPDTTEEYLRPSDVAHLFNVSPKTVTRWAAAGKLPYRKTLGGQRRYPADAVRQLLRASSTERTGERDDERDGEA
jgi:excisionase family DNA binding protein